MFSGQYSVIFCLIMMRDMPHNGEKEGRQGRVNIWQRGLEDSKSGGGSYGVDVWDHAMMGHKNSIRIAKRTISVLGIPSILNLHFCLLISLFLCLFHGHQLFETSVDRARLLLCLMLPPESVPTNSMTGAKNFPHHF